MEVPIVINGTKARNIIALERQQKAIELRMQGWSYARIAAQLGVTDVAVLKMVKKALSRRLTTLSETVEEARQQEIERLDAMVAAHWEWAMKGDEKSSAIILRCMERRSSLLGLDAPKKVEVTEKSDIDKQLEKLLERVRSGGPQRSRQVPFTVEVECTTEPVDAGGTVERLALPSGSRVGEDADGGGGSSPLRDQEST